MKLPISIRILFLVTFVFCVLNNVARAQYSQQEGRYIDPTVRTNVNVIDPLFENNITNYDNYRQSLSNQHENAAASVRPENVRAVEKATEDKKEDEEEKEAEDNKVYVNELSKIGARDLEGRGKEEMAKKNWLNEYLVDYSRPGMARAKEDMKEIAEGTNKMMNDILKLIKDLGVDCKSIKGTKIVEPQYHVVLTNRATNRDNTFYDQHFCERLRNNYRCTDKVKLTCAKKGKRYHEFQDREIAFDGNMLYWQQVNWGWSIKHDYKYHIWYIHKNHPGGSESVLNSQQINDSARQFIANTINAPIDQIGEVVDFPDEGKGLGAITPLRSRWRQAWDKYEFKYKYREVYEVCEEWAEDWSETCSLN